MRWFKGAAALAAACLLAGCSAAPAGVEDLLRAPQLDGQQNEVERPSRSWVTTHSPFTDSSTARWTFWPLAVLT